MKIAIFSAAVLASQMVVAAVPVNGWYTSVFGGYAYVPNNISTNIHGFLLTDATYHSGFDAGASFGFKANPLRYEGELTYLKADLDGYKINGLSRTGVEGYAKGLLAMANVYYDFPDFLPCIQPFLGVGVGYGWVESQLKSRGFIYRSRHTANNSVFAYQPIAGLTYNFSENYALAISYRYVGTGRADEFGKVFQAHLANAAFVIRFDQVNYK